MNDKLIQEQLAAIDRSLGIGGPDPAMVQSFRDAGFGDADAVRGARLMESGRYFSFTDAAMSLAAVHHAGGVTPPSAVRQTQIAEAARAFEERAAVRNRERTSPWGREPVKESGGRSPWGRDTRVREPSAQDFVDVGLSIAEAAEAHGGLKAGRYISFEDACLSVARAKGTSALREAAMRTRARRFIPVSGD